MCVCVCVCVCVYVCVCVNVQNIKKTRHSEDDFLNQKLNNLATLNLSFLH